MRPALDILRLGTDGSSKRSRIAALNAACRHPSGTWLGLDIKKIKHDGMSLDSSIRVTLRYVSGTLLPAAIAQCSE